jgi:branched-chain amino acid transport system permease protein/urea transport system permease protein
MDAIFTTALNAMTLISVLMLVAVGLAITFGLMGIINLAHGEFVTLGAFSLYLSQLWHLPFALGCVLAAAVGALVGVVLQITVVRHLDDKPTSMVLATWGVSLILQQSLEMLFGRGGKPVASPLEGLWTWGDFSYPAYRLMLIAVSCSALAGLWVLMRRSRFGLDIRSVIQNRAMAEAMGIDTQRTFNIAFAAGAALAAFAGALVAPLGTVIAQMGVNYLANSFFVVIVGGVGSIAGVVAGSAFIGGLTNALSYQMPPSLAQALVLICAVVLVRIRPQGLVKA